MKHSHSFFSVLLLIMLYSSVFAQLNYERKIVTVPKADSGAVVVDGVMDEAVWDDAGQANLIT
ncbi:MAG: hypothetical protein JW995_12575, partial [Melioribacteraceae bacterium]|nr:hypothetical protein [Melioribacteraceae bacterium]